MKKSFLLVLFVAMTFVAKAADTTYVNAPEISGMLADYIINAYSYEVSPEVREMINENPDVVSSVKKWAETKDGHIHTMTDVKWEQKYESFFKMFPDYKVKRNVVVKIIKKDVIFRIKLFKYASNCNIILIDGNVHGFVFFHRNPDEPMMWHKTLEDNTLKTLCEKGTDIDGITWNYKIQRCLNKQKRVH